MRDILILQDLVEQVKEALQEMFVTYNHYQVEMSRTTGEIFTDQVGVCCAIPFAYIYGMGGTAWGGPAERC